MDKFEKYLENLKIELETLVTERIEEADRQLKLELAKEAEQKLRAERLANYYIPETRVEDGGDIVLPKIISPESLINTAIKCYDLSCKVDENEMEHLLEIHPHLVCNVRGLKHDSEYGSKFCRIIVGAHKKQPRCHYDKDKNNLLWESEGPIWPTYLHEFVVDKSRIDLLKFSETCMKYDAKRTTYFEKK